MIRGRILVAYDGTPSARRALQRAATMHRDGDDLALVRVREGDEDVDGTAGGGARAAGASGASRRRRSPLVGSPARAICVKAERDGYDVIVVGRRNLRDTGQLLLGSVAARIVAGAPCDVVVVA